MPTFNTTDPKPGYVYDAATDTWFPLLGIAPASEVNRWTKTAAGAETSLSGNDDNAVSLSYTAGTEQVYLNGVLLVRGQDYTASNGTTITGLTALSASDIAEVITFNPSNIITTDAVLSTDFDAKGDLISASAASVPIRVPVGTNGQVLKANSATTSGLEWGTVDADITEVVAGTGLSGGGTSGSVTLTNTVATTLDAAGDIIYASAADTPARLAIGTAGQFLAVNGGATAPQWVAAPTASANWSLLNAGGTALTGASTITVSGISNADKIFVLVYNSSSNSAYSEITLRLNADSGSNYRHVGEEFYNSGGSGVNNSTSRTSILIGRNVNDAVGQISGIVEISGCNTSGLKVFSSKGISGNLDSNYRNYITSGVYSGSSAITSISILSDSGNFDNGTIFVYTSA